MGYPRTPRPSRTESDRSNAGTQSRSLTAGVYLLVVAGVMFVLHGLGFVYRTYYTDGFELGVARLDGVNAAELASSHPEVASYIDHLHVSFAGLMVATGVGVVLLAAYGVADRQRWALATAVLVPLLFGAFSLPVHQTVHFEFDALVHLGPAMVGLPVLLAGALLAHRGMAEA